MSSGQCNRAHKRWGYHELITNSVDELLNQVLDCPAGKARRTMYVNGKPLTIKMGSLRLQCFRANRACAACGIPISHASLNGDRVRGPEQPHINMWAADGRLMTRDHIVPVSRGGANTLENSQTMCEVCNTLKGNQMP